MTAPISAAQSQFGPAVGPGGAGGGGASCSTVGSSATGAGVGTVSSTAGSQVGRSSSTRCAFRMVTAPDLAQDCIIRDGSGRRIYEGNLHQLWAVEAGGREQGGSGR